MGRFKLKPIILVAGLLLAFTGSLVAFSGAFFTSTYTNSGSTASSQTVFAPRNTVIPSATDGPVVGNRLTAATGTWLGTGIGYTYQWQSCDGTGLVCANIVGATASTYTIVLTDLGQRLRVQVKATNAGGNLTVASSALTAVITTYSSTPQTGFVGVDGGTVLTMQRSGNTMYLGGTFLYMGARTGPYVSLSPSTGLYDNTAAKFAGGQVTAMIDDGSGGVYVGGSFTHVNGSTTRARLVHLTSGGSVDATFTPTATTGQVYALALSGSTLYVGGSFTTMGGQTRNRLAAVSATTGVATAWNPNVNNTVRALVADATNVYAGGDFTTVAGGGTARNRLASWAISSGTVTAWNPNASGAVYALTLSASGSAVYAGGLFATVGGVSVNNMSNIDVSTGVATALYTGGSVGSNGAVYNMLRSGSTLYLSGAFTSVGGTTRNRAAALTLGAPNTLAAFNPNFNSNVWGMALNGTTLYLSGDFTTVGGATTRNRMAAWNTTTSTVTAWDPGAGSTVFVLNATGSAVLAGGGFQTVNGVARNRAGALDLTTGQPTSFNPNANNAVNAMVLDGSTLYLGGTFTNVNGTARNRLAAWNTGTNTLAAFNPNMNGTVSALAVDSSSNVYVGGAFTGAGAVVVTRNRVASFTSAGTLRAWNPNLGSTAEALVVDGSTVYLGGAFTTVGGVARNRLASVDSSSGALSSFDPNLNNTVRALTITGTDLYAGGDFTTAAGGASTRTRLAAFTTTTGALQSWAPAASSTVRGLATDSDFVYVAGSQTTLGGVADTYGGAVLRRNGLGVISFAPLLNNAQYCVQVTPSVLYLGGSASAINGTPHPGFNSFAHS